MYREAPHVGIPLEMDRLADRLVRMADEVAGSASGFQARAESIDFLGPAATRFRASITAQRRSAQDVSQRAVALSHILRRAAEDARAQLAAWERYVASLERNDG